MKAYRLLLSILLLIFISGCSEREFLNTTGTHHISLSHSIEVQETDSRLNCKIRKLNGDITASFEIPKKSGWFIYPVNKSLIWAYDGDALAYCYTDEKIGSYESGLYDMLAENASNSTLNPPQAFIERLNP